MAMAIIIIPTPGWVCRNKKESHGSIKRENNGEENRVRLGKVAFIVTKPLQLMVAMTLREQLGLGHRAQLLLVSDFSEADKIFGLISEHDRQWSSARMYVTRKAALNACQRMAFDTIFIDSDVGVRTGLSLCKIRMRGRHTRIYVYEEGCGTYQDDYYTPSKAALLRLLGAGDRLGGSRFTKGIWVYAPHEYVNRCSPKKLPVHKIHKGLSDFVSENGPLLDKLFCGASDSITSVKENDHCIVYLSSWKVYESDIANLSRHSTRYIKLHPHIRGYDTSFLEEGSVLVPSSMPAELLLINLAKHYRSIDVYHHDSSVERYIDMPNISFINIHEY